MYIENIYVQFVLYCTSRADRDSAETDCYYRRSCKDSNGHEEGLETLGFLPLLEIEYIVMSIIHLYVINILWHPTFLNNIYNNYNR